MSAPRISSQLQREVSRRVRDRSPNAYLLSYTKSPRRAGSMSRAGAVELPPDEYVAMHEWNEGSDDARHKTLERRLGKQRLGWRALLLDLMENRESAPAKPK